MIKTTVYLPERVKARLRRLAARTRTSEATLIRTAVERLVADAPSPRPRPALFDSGDPTLAERVDDILAEGFGR